MSGEKVVVSYAAIEAARSEFTAATETLASIMTGLAPVGSSSLHAKKLDAALEDYRGLLKTASTELHERLSQLASFLATSERCYRWVDETALRRAVPYDPHHPSPTMVVSKIDAPFVFGVLETPSSTDAALGGVPGAQHGTSGTRVNGVPSDAQGGGAVVATDPADVAARRASDGIDVNDPATLQSIAGDGVISPPGVLTLPPNLDHLGDV